MFSSLPFYFTICFPSVRHCFIDIEHNEVHPDKRLLITSFPRSILSNDPFSHTRTHQTTTNYTHSQKPWKQSQMRVVTTWRYDALRDDATVCCVASASGRRSVVALAQKLQRPHYHGLLFS